MPPYLLLRIFMEKEILISCSGANLELIIVAIMILIKIKIAYTPKQFACLASWVVSSVMAFVIDYYLYVNDSIKAVPVMLVMLCVIIPLNIVFAQRVFRGFEVVDAYVYVSKFILYLILIITSIIQLFTDYGRLGLIATGLGITFAIFELNEMMLEMKKRCKGKSS